MSRVSDCPVCAQAEVWCDECRDYWLDVEDSELPEVVSKR